MPYKDPERKKEWERMHRPERLARRRELRRTRGAQSRVTRPRIADQESGTGIGFLISLIAGGSLAAYNPILGMGAGGLTLIVAAVWKKNWTWWVVGGVVLLIGLLFYFMEDEKPDNSTGSGLQV
jgi:hypothetical protein